ncbi:MAG: 16S rRNA (uracil(1498)-N(3))-methyltransferase [Candidatus ainarchaeum sp.]|nr:16S rRNA (uracil(1498)-N(3))-methyltransferase [Candidatus ainarchaeum sp.]MDD4278504.1 16S rRNA (uracil(1498)-N(3))-methyltransferase [Candidatus Sumerlaeales bacterium]
MSHYYYLGNALEKIDKDCVVSSVVKLDANESHHLLNVCRTRIGDTIFAFGSNRRFHVEVVSIEKKFVYVKILDEITDTKVKNHSICCAIPVLKGGKTEYLIEKLTELDIDRIVVFSSERTIVKDLDTAKLERYNRVALEAAKQSERFCLPLLKVANSIPNAISAMEIKRDETVVAIEREKTSLFSHCLESLGTQNFGLVSGPEGGFTSQEIELLSSMGHAVTLGKSILRAETAAFVMAVGVKMHLGEF